MADNTQTLQSLMDDLDEQVEQSDDLAVRDVLEAFEGRVFGPLIAIPGLLALSPVGAVPGVPTLIALFVLLIAAQHLAGLDHPWIPKALADRSVDRDRWDKTRVRLDPWAERIDRLVEPRLTWLTAGPMQRVIGAVALLLALCMPPLEVVPFAVAVPGATLLILGLGLTARDGLSTLAGLAGAAGTLWLAITALQKL